MNNQEQQPSKAQAVISLIIAIVSIIGAIYAFKVLF